MDIDLSKAKPDGAAQIIQHFTKPLDVAAELEAIDQEAKADLPNPLDFAALSEEMCKEIEEAQNKAAFWEGRLKSLKDQAKRLVGKERGLLPYGAYALEIKESKGRTSVKWEKFVHATQGPEGVEEAKAKYSETGDPVISLSVKKLR